MILPDGVGRLFDIPARPVFDFLGGNSMSITARLRQAARLLLLGVLCATTAQALAARTLIHAGTLIDGLGGKPVTERTIVVDGERIVSIERGYLDPEQGDTVIDLSGQTVMPGLIDMHVHLESQINPHTNIERFTLNPTDRAFRSVVHAKRTLDAGFTTVRDLGSHDHVVLSLRDAVNQGLVPGPRIIAAGEAIATTGGHADPTNGARDGLFPEPTPANAVINGPVEARAAVRYRYKEGADTIKITATGGVLSQAKDGAGAQFTIEEIESVVAAAKDYGYIVAAHAHGDEGIRRAVLGGVTTIEHGTFMSEATMDLMKKHHTWYVPTLEAGRFVADKAKIDGYFSELVRPKAAAIGPKLQATFAKAYKRGVPILFGTDTGVSPHGDNWKEFTYMVEAGMPALEAITCATSKPAMVLGRDADIGSIRPGRYADIIAVPGDPLADIQLMGKVDFVMKGGKVERSDG